MPVFPGYPLSTSYSDATASPTIHPGAHNEERAALNAIGAAMSAVRRIETRPATTYAAGDQSVTPTVLSSNVGGITRSGVTWTLPSLGLYTITGRFNRSAGLGSSNVASLNLTIGGTLYRFPVTFNTAGMQTCSAQLWLAASTTVVFGINPSVSTDNVLFYGSIIKIPSMDP